MTGATVSAGLARGLVEFAAGRGCSRDTLAEAAGIHLPDFEDQDRRVPFQIYVRLTRVAKQLTGDPALPLHYGAAVDMLEFSVVGLLFRTCATLLDAIVQVNRYGQLVIQVDLGCGNRFQWERRDGRLYLVDTRLNPNLFPELTEATFARFVSMTERVGMDPLVLEVEVTHPPPAHAVEYAKVLRAPTRFSAARNAILIDERKLLQPIAQQPRYAFGILTAHATELLRKLEDLRTARSEIEAMLMPVLHHGNVGIEELAQRLGTSRATLYRRLKAEGVTFEQVLDELRRELALLYLSGKKVSVHETAYLVGFADPASFSRAFKRWTGLSPRSYMLRNGGA